MKASSFTLIFFGSLVFTFAAQLPTDEDKKDLALKECNVTNNVQRDPREVIAMAIFTETKANLTQEEKCNLFCFLQKVKFVDDNANMRGVGVFKYLVRNAPEIVPYSDVIIAQLFRNIRSTKNIQDKCEKAFVTYQKFGEDIFTLAIAHGLIGTKDKIKTTLDKGEALSPELQSDVEQYLQLVGELAKNVPETAFGRIAQKVAIKIITGVCLTCIQ